MPDPLLYRWGVPPVVIRCVHWTMQMWVLQTWITALGLAIVMRSCKASKVWDRWLQFSNCSESWQASRQHCCWGAHQISYRYKHFNAQLASSRLCKILWWHILCNIESVPRWWFGNISSQGVIRNFWPNLCTPPSAQLPSVTAVWSGNHHHAPLQLGYCQQWTEWGLIRSISPLFSAVFEAAFDKLQS